MSCDGTSGCLCGCCAGTSVQTPQQPVNLPGLSSVSRRIGTWATFKESLLARLSSSDYPALASLRARSDDDFTVAFLDASAMVLDILTFYQERLANESYLRTAGQLRSLSELSRLIGYQPSPGVSASTYLAFTLKAAPGQTSKPSAAAITIPAGTQVQSVPAQGQAPQTFETSADIQAKADWTSLAVQTAQPWVPKAGDTFVYLNGISTQLNPGDAILVVGADRAADPESTLWDVVFLQTVEVDTTHKWTRISWLTGLGGTYSLVGNNVAAIHAFRQRASLFGYNAVDPNLLNQTNTNIGGELVSNGLDEFRMVALEAPGGGLEFTPPPPSYSWSNFGVGGTIDLDSAYSKIVPNGWAALVLPGDLPDLYQVQSVSSISISQFGMSSKISRVTPDVTSTLGAYDRRTTLALVQSEALTVAEQPLTYPLYGTVLDLADLRPDLVGAQLVALSGTRQRISVAQAATTLSFIPDDSSAIGARTLNPGDVLILTNPLNLPASLAVPDPATGRIPDWNDPATAAVMIASLSVEDARGRTGTIQNVRIGQFSLAPSDARDPLVSEYALVSSVGPAGSPYAHTRIQLMNPLGNCYDRASTTVNANVGAATQGRSVSEIIGSGNASMPNQSFVLKQAPVTFVQSPTASGRLSTLKVQVNSVAWSEAPTLYDQTSSRPVFATLNQADATTEILFGDGVEGALLPTGQNNLQASYRVGLGSAGNVGSGTLSTLVDRPLGVSGVTNPQPANGGQDPQSADDIRSNAPLTVLTLGRAVSITDYQNFAGTFAGIAKAYALWIPSGPGRGVFLTVAGVDGAVLPAGSSTLSGLFTALQNYGNPRIPITVSSFVETLFQFSADLQYLPGYDPSSVQSQAFQAVTGAFNFESRSFGQGVSVDELSAVIQAVPGVAAVNVTRIWRTTSSTGGDISGQGALTVTQWNAWLAAATNLPRIFPDTPNQLFASLPLANPLSPPLPAEILVLDPALSPASWGVLS
jgi:hypothetical protein